MSSSQSKAKQSSRWGNIFSGAVAGLESRLDNILGDDPEASAKSRAIDKAQAEANSTSSSRQELVPAIGEAQRSPSKNRHSDRLQERLAKALVSRAEAQSKTGESPPSGTDTLITGDGSPRASRGSRTSADLVRRSSDVNDEDVLTHDHQLSLQDQAASEGTANTLLNSALPINPARISHESTTRSPVDAAEADPIVNHATTNGHFLHGTSQAELEAVVAHLHRELAQAEIQREQEMHANMERIDALQAKLQYLAKETVAAVKEANSESAAGSLERKVAEKDQRIALLMEEGEILSKGEYRQRETIRRLDARVKGQSKELSDFKKQVDKLQSLNSDFAQRLRRLDQLEKHTTEQAIKITQGDRETSLLRQELQSEKQVTQTLRAELEEVRRSGSSEAPKVGDSSFQTTSVSKRILDMQEELESVSIQRQIADQKSAAEIRKLREEVKRANHTAQSTENELRAEISSLESRVEALRYRAEQVSSDSGGDVQAKLLRQVETLQTQYTLAVENWQSIEGSLTTRVTIVEKERDEANKREADARKKAREATARLRKLEDDSESSLEKARSAHSDLLEQQREVERLTSKLADAQKAVADQQADFDRQRRMWESETMQRIEEEKQRSTSHGLMTRALQSPKSPTGQHRKQFTLETFGQAHSRRGTNRLISGDSVSSLAVDRTGSRRSSILPLGPNTPSARPSLSGISDYAGSPIISRPESTLSLSHMTNTSSAYASLPPTPSAVADDDHASNASDSPHHTVADMVSASTVHTGPSVQLVERMSASIRRLEGEKASHKEELTRLTSQRDSARDQVVSTMRELEQSRGICDRSKTLEHDMDELKGRYEACLEMLGEREEEVSELREDLNEMKRVYKELAEKMGR